MSEHHWIGAAIRHHGVFRGAAKRAGMSTEAYAHKHEKSPGILGQRARLALTLMGMHEHDASQTPEAAIDKHMAKAKGKL